MLQAGKSITQINDPLVKIQPEQLYYAVKNPKPEILAAIRQLRMVRAIDENRYRQLKKQLPYITCGIFNPPYRRTENFGWISHFIVDIDHVSEKGLSMQSLREKLCTDLRVKILFNSPGEDGLKLLFQLTDKCYDTAQYSIFYKLFVRSFSVQYHLEQVTDFRTSDAARACFISFDPEAYFNPEAEPVNLKALVDLENPFGMSELKREIQEEEKQMKLDRPETTVKVVDPNADALAMIKARLNPSRKPEREKLIYVPEEIENIVANVIVQMETFNISTKNVVNINYGKKFIFLLENREAEINVFYGKKGFSIVQSPRRGTNPELNEITARILGEMLF